MSNKWYVLKIKNGYELYIKSQIIEILLSYKIKKYKIIIPFKKKIIIKNNKKYYYKKNLLPGYLIANLILNNKIIYNIKKINGVIDFLNKKHNKNPLPFYKKDLIIFLKNYKKIKNINTNRLNFIKGDKVKITKGIFYGLNGEIEKVNKKKEEVLLYVYILGRKVPIKIKLYNLIKI